MTGNRYYIYIYIIEYRIEYYVLIDWVVGLDGNIWLEVMTYGLSAAFYHMTRKC